MEKEGYFTLKGYRLREAGRITDAMEDYVEMLFREGQGGEVRTGRLAQLLHVRPSSVSKMAAVLREEGLAEYQPYEAIALTPGGGSWGLTSSGGTRCCGGSSAASTGRRAAWRRWSSWSTSSAPGR